MTDKLLTVKQTAQRLGVTTATLREWDRQGIFVADYRTPRGQHRRYLESKVESFKWSPKP